MATVCTVHCKMFIHKYATHQIITFPQHERRMKRQIPPIVCNVHLKSYPWKLSIISGNHALIPPPPSPPSAS
jgi:hypothetical protein